MILGRVNGSWTPARPGKRAMITFLILSEFGSIVDVEAWANEDLRLLRFKRHGG